MIEISSGFTSISAGSDSLEGDAQPRPPTGARITFEFSRTESLGPDELVRLRYDFADDGHVRECTGIAMPIQTVARWNRSALFCYRVSQWIDPSALMHFVSREVRSRAARPAAAQPRRQREQSIVRMAEFADEVPAIDPFRA
jgi:hypothetical protein